MLSIPSAVRIYLHAAPVDLRRGFDGLAALARGAFGQDPLSGHLFVFRNRRADRVKILYWDRDGYALWMKRLEQGTFRFPAGPAAALTVTPTELALLLGGVDLDQARRRPRYTPPELTAT